MLDEQEKLKKWFDNSYRRVYKYSCLTCGKEFYTTMPTRRYCGYACKEKARQARKHVQQHAEYNSSCIVCNSLFQAHRSGALYCSSACRQAAYRARYR